MLLNAVLTCNLGLIIGFGVVFALVGLVFRTGPSGKADRDNLVYADGLQGVTVATLFVVATMIIYIADQRAVSVLREQAGTLSTFSLLGAIQVVDRFRRSLKG